MCELIQDYICKHCAGDLYIEKKIDKDNQFNSTYKAIMNYQEAIELLNELLLKGNFTDQYGDMDDSSPYEEAINIAVKAIEKQIPQKLKIETLECMIQGYSYMDKCCVCPSCGEFRGNLDYEPFKIKKYSFCPDCGQALDWSDENE